MTVTIWEDLEDITPANPTDSPYENAQIVQLDNGNILITYETTNPAGSGAPDGYDILGQIFDPFGNAVGGEFRLNTNFNGDNEQDYVLATDTDGGFSIAYADISDTNDSYDLAFQHFNANGAADYSVKFATYGIGQTNAQTFGRDPQVSNGPEDNLLVTWVEYTPNFPGSTEGTAIIKGRMIDSTTQSMGVTFDISGSYGYGENSTEGVPSHTVITRADGTHVVALVNGNSSGFI